MVPPIRGFHLTASPLSWLGRSRRPPSIPHTYSSKAFTAAEPSHAGSISTLSRPSTSAPIASDTVKVDTEMAMHIDSVVAAWPRTCTPSKDSLPEYPPVVPLCNRTQSIPDSLSPRAMLALPLASVTELRSETALSRCNMEAAMTAEKPSEHDFQTDKTGQDNYLPMPEERYSSSDSECTDSRGINGEDSWAYDSSSSSSLSRWNTTTSSVDGGVPVERQDSEKEPTSRCGLLRLPPDIRNLIYNEVFYEPSGVIVEFNSKVLAPHPAHLFALAYTCKEIYHETSGLPFWLNTFHLHVPVLQDLWTSQDTQTSHYDWSPTKLCPRRKTYMLPRRQGSLTSRSLAMRKKAQEFITLAMRLPHMEEIIGRFDRIVTSNRNIVQRLQNVTIHLGSQTTPFAERFNTAWDSFLPLLLSLAAKIPNVRVAFGLRISRRLNIDYEFRIDPETLMKDMDACVVVPQDGPLTLPELGTINSVRMRIWKGFFECQEDGPSRSAFTNWQGSKVMSALAGKEVLKSAAVTAAGGQRAQEPLLSFE